MKATTSQTRGFIAVFRPHQRPAVAMYFSSEDDFVRAWLNGRFARFHATNEDGAHPETFAGAWADAGHDLYALTRLDSPAEVIEYLSYTIDSQVYCVACNEGWIVDDDHDDDDDEHWFASDDDDDDDDDT